MYQGKFSKLMNDKLLNNTPILIKYHCVPMATLDGR